MFRLLKRKRDERAMVMKYLEDIDKQTKMLIEKNQKDLDLWKGLQKVTKGTSTNVPFFIKKEYIKQRRFKK